MRILVVTFGLLALVTSGHAQLPIDTRDLRLQIATGETITLNAPVGTAGYSLTLPTTRGSSGSLLSSDGAGGLLWVAPNTTFWQLTGNTLLDSTTAFLGSPDEAVGRPLIMRTDGTERLRIAGGSGFVGIGTSSPGMVLDVAGTFRASGMATMLSGMLVTGSTTINSTGTAATTLGNTGSSVTIGSVGGTVKTSVGANDRVVLANSSGLLDQASISSVVAAGIAGNAWSLTGNSLSSASGSLGSAPTGSFLGSTTALPLNIVTNNAIRMIVATDGAITMGGTLGVTGATTLSGGATITGTTSINTTGTLATTIGNAGSSVTIGSVAGTAKSSVGLNDRFVIADSTGKLDQASISSVLASGVSSNAWSLTGNSGTTSSGALGSAPGSKFLGTTDSVDVRFATNNKVRLILSGDGKLSTQKDMTVNGVTVGLGSGDDTMSLAVGRGALASKSTLPYYTSNTAIGTYALNRLTTGINNTALGWNVMPNITTGVQNTAIGTAAMALGTTASNNIALGFQALYAMTNGLSNVAVGNGALNGLQYGNFNVAVGDNAFMHLDGASQDNVAIGAEAGAWVGATVNNTIMKQGSGNIFIGRYTRSVADSQSNQIVIGYDAIGIGSNAVVLGNSAITKTRLFGNVGIGTSDPTYGLDLVGSARMTGIVQINPTGTAYMTIGNSGSYLFVNSIAGSVKTSVGSNDRIVLADSDGKIDQASISSVIGAGIAGNAWALAGNSITNSSTQFLGTTSAQPLVIRTNNTEKMRVTSSGLVLIGSSSGTNTLDVTGTMGVTGLITGTGGATITGATLINSTGTAATTLGNTGSSVTIGSVGGTVKTSVGANDRVVLANSSGLLDQASISSVVAAGIVGNAWALTGNSGTTNGGTLGSAPTGNFIGTTGTTGAGTARDLSLVTNNVIQAQLSTAGVLSTQNDMVVNGVTVGRGAGSLASNTAVGASALNANTTGGTGNSAFGQNALKANTTGDDNSAFGRNALQASTTGFDNTAIGSEALYGNTSGYFNTASGSKALYSNTTGVNNTASGWRALNMNTDGTYNTASGAGALELNTTGSFNTASGASALNNNTTGASNTASGYLALSSNTTGASNTASGVHALKANTTGSFNTASGVYALTSNTTASSNTANGYNALYSNTTGQSNTAIGVNALAGNTTASANTALGRSAGEFITDGTTSNATGSNSLFLGSDTRANADAQTNQIVIGYQATGLGSNSVILGNSSITATRLQGRVGIGMDPTGASNVTGLFVRAGSSQSSNNVFEAQNNGGTALVSIGSTGLITGTGGATITGATLINSTGTAATTLGNTGSSVTIGSVGGTVKTSVGANDRVVLANSSGLLDQASISSVVAAGIVGNAWALTGNSGTDSTTNYIGTADETVGRPLVIRTDGTERMRVAGGSGNVGVGTAAPNVRMDVDGGLATRPTTVSATGATTAITVGNRSFVVVTSDEVFSSRRLTLSDGLQDGQRLVILVLGSGGNSTFGARLETSDSNLRLSGDAGLEHNDTIELVWYSSNWFELKRSANDD